MIFRASRMLLFLAGTVPCFGSTVDRVVLDRDGSSIVLEPYAPNIIRVTLSRLKEKAIAGPGYGFIGTPYAKDWQHDKDAREFGISPD